MTNPQSLTEFLDALASKSPAPGGGAGAALSGALGAALVSMVCNLTSGNAKYAAVQDEISQMLRSSEMLRAELTRLIGEDETAFSQVGAAYQLPRGSDEQKTVRKLAVQQALRGAEVVPIQVMRACQQVLDLCEPAARLGNANVVSDAGVAALLAEAGLQSAALNVRINLNAIEDAEFVAAEEAQMRALIASASNSRALALAAVNEKLTKQL